MKDSTTGRSDGETPLLLLLGLFVLAPLIDQLSIVLSVWPVDIALQYPTPIFGLLLLMVTMTVGGIAGVVAVQKAAPVPMPTFSAAAGMASSVCLPPAVLALWIQLDVTRQFLFPMCVATAALQTLLLAASLRKQMEQAVTISLCLLPGTATGLTMGLYQAAIIGHL